MVDAGRKIVVQQGVLGLFQGHSATLLRIFPYAAVKYMAYDFMHMLLMPKPRDETPIRLFLAGSLSGVVSVLLTYPLDLIRVRLAFDTKTHPQYGGLFRIIGKIYREGGTASHPDTRSVMERIPLLKFYRGFSATILGMIPYAGTSFLVFGWTKAFFYRVFLNQDTHGQPLTEAPPFFRVSRTFVDLTAGALAGAMSQTASYPFEIIRRRQQVGGILHPERMMRITETAKLIYQTNGIRGFYIGLCIGYLKIVPMTAISFAVWSGMKRQLGI